MRNLARERGLGNIGPGASKKLPDKPPVVGTLAADIAARCACEGGLGECHGRGECRW
jgi:hypothetical protein